MSFEDINFYGVPVIQNTKDGYVNLSKLCEDNNYTINDVLLFPPF